MVFVLEKYYSKNTPHIILQIGIKEFHAPSFLLWGKTGGDIRQAIDRCSNIWASLPGAGYGQFEHKADNLIAKFKEAGGTVREIEV